MKTWNCIMFAMLTVVLVAAHNVMAQECSDSLFIDWDTNSPPIYTCVNVCVDEDSVTHVFVGPFDGECVSHFPEPMGGFWVQVTWWNHCPPSQCPTGTGVGHHRSDRELGNWVEIGSLWYRHFELVVSQGGCLNLELPRSLSGFSADCWLPVELQTFEATARDGEVTISWVTASELDNASFEIWKGREHDGVFAQIVSLPSEGNATSGHSYQFVDALVTAGYTYWYYLVDIDLDGTRTEHRGLMKSATVIDLHEVVSSRSLSSYPNPFNPNTTIAFTLDKPEPVKLVVYDLNGREVETLIDEAMPRGEHTLNFDGSALPSGLYFARMQTGSGIAKTVKLALVK